MYLRERARVPLPQLSRLAASARARTAPTSPSPPGTSPPSTTTRECRDNHARRLPRTAGASFCFFSFVVWGGGVAWVPLRAWGASECAALGADGECESELVCVCESESARVSVGACG
eukprot:3557792-Pleurochrysis_carterae.AAC.2